ncbi:cAMP-responsive element modulator-like [Lethenteron reissneri]|uniref:cAMP-responsive element modulator-like n=1 Tax=Lethenteron reissneri TaxID=7753 RepID=UPI002AB69A62|nr:cAMP-responsive element modulator-like [Lethenteron reissneri]XP_061410831.1 cAMP-responsive element modulator-like [Lethenteron reissneri]
MSEGQQETATSSTSEGETRLALTQSSQAVPEDRMHNREVRRMKNREAVKECRRRQKEYVRCLENRVEVLAVQNRQLLDELSGLKKQFGLNPGSAGQ